MNGAMERIFHSLSLVLFFGKKGKLGFELANFLNDQKAND